MDLQAELTVKHQRIVEYLQAHQLEAVLLSRRCNFAWLSGGGQAHVNQATDLAVASLLVTERCIRCLCPNIEADRLRDEELGQLGIEVVSYPWWRPDELAGRLAELVDPQHVAADAPLAGLAGTVGRLGSDFDRLRWQLTAAETDRYRALGRVVAQAIEAAAREARPQMSEHELAARMVGPLQAGGVQTPVVLVAADQRIARYRHPIPTDNRLQRYAMLVICGQRWGLICSATRLVSLGRPEPELRRKHQAVCQIDATMIAATRPGQTLGQIFAQAQAAYAQAGYPDEWQNHHQGGPTGYLSREAKASPGSTITVLPDQAFAWNPSIRGTKSEDTIVVTPAGNEILTATGDWPTVQIEVAGTSWARPDILVL